MGRGGALVAATIAALENKAAARAPVVAGSSFGARRPSAESDPKPKSEDNERHSDRPISTGSDTSERDSVSLQSSEVESEDCVRKSVASDRLNQHNGKGSGDSDSAGEESSTVKCNTWSGSDGSLRASREKSNSSASSSSSDDIPMNKRKGESSTRCDNDFKWMAAAADAKAAEMASSSKPEPPKPDVEIDRKSVGSLDRRRQRTTNRTDRDTKSKSSFTLKPPQHPSSKHSPSPSRPPQALGFDDAPYYPPMYPRNVAELNKRSHSFENFHKRHERTDPHIYGSNSIISERRSPSARHKEYKEHRPVDYHGHYDPSRSCGSRHDLCGSHADINYYGNSHYGHHCFCHQPMPPCYTYPEHIRCRNPYSYKNIDGDDRVRRLESDRDNLQLQVSVLTEQIAAQEEKIGDLERLLQEKKAQLEQSDEILQREMLQRSSLETQKLELMSTLSELRLRHAAAERSGILSDRGMSASPVPSPAPPHGPPRTPPATYRRQIDRSAFAYGSLPRYASSAGDTSSPQLSPSQQQSLRAGKQSLLSHSVAHTPTANHNAMVVARDRGHSVPNLADREEIANGTRHGSPSPMRWVAAVRARGGSHELEGAPNSTSTPTPPAPGGLSLQRGGLRATAAPRLQRDHPPAWSSTPPEEWDSEITCEWLDSLGLDVYVNDAKKWLNSETGSKGILAAATSNQIEKELSIKHPMHKKKILLGLLDLQGGGGDSHLRSAGRLDNGWALRWLEDAGLPQHRDAASAVKLDARMLHRLTHDDLHHHLRVASALHAASVRRGIQVLRENSFSPDTMIRRSANNSTVENGNEVEVTASLSADDTTASGASGEETCADAHLVGRWSSHRVMEWLCAIDLAEYAPNLRGAGVHGGLMLYDPRFTAELLATLLNIPTSKTLLRRHLTTRFNQLLGSDVIKEKREAEQTLGYQPLTMTTKYKVPKKNQFTLKRRKNKEELEVGDLVCPFVDNGSGDTTSSLRTMTDVRMEAADGKAEAAYQAPGDSPRSHTSSHHSST